MRHQAFLFRYHGRYYVKYPYGGESGLMDKATARDYAEMFGGEVKTAQPVYKRFGLFGCFRKLVGYE